MHPSFLNKVIHPFNLPVLPLSRRGVTSVALERHLAGGAGGAAEMRSLVLNGKKLQGAVTTRVRGAAAPGPPGRRKCPRQNEHCGLKQHSFGVSAEARRGRAEWAG